ncbi:hypothetical protein BJX70DRAFT_401738 [Aspergillus crustosus]
MSTAGATAVVYRVPRFRNPGLSNGDSGAGGNALVSTADGSAHQGDGIHVSEDQPLNLNYHFLGERGFSSIKAFNASGLVWARNFWSESSAPAKLLRVTWGGARLYNRYREVIWNGTIAVSDDSSIQNVVLFRGLENNPEDFARKTDNNATSFSSKTSGDLDRVNITLNALGSWGPQPTVTVSGSMGGYIKVGDALARNPHKAQPSFILKVSWEEASRPGGKQIGIQGGAEMFVRVEAVPDIKLPRRVQGDVTLDRTTTTETTRAVYFGGGEWSGAKVVTSPIFLSSV